MLSSQNDGARESGDDRLRDVIARIFAHLLAKFFALRLRRLRADEHAVAAAFVRRFHDQLRNVFEDISEIFFHRREIGRDVRQDRIFARGNNESSSGRNGRPTLSSAMPVPMEFARLTFPSR